LRVDANGRSGRLSYGLRTSRSGVRVSPGASELLNKLDDFRFRYRFESRTAAVHWLLEEGIDKKLAPAKESKKGK
jgi:hypothetical protein